MIICYAPPDKAWGGFLDLIRAKLAEYHFKASGRFEVDNLKWDDVLASTPIS